MAYYITPGRSKYQEKKFPIYYDIMLAEILSKAEYNYGITDLQDPALIFYISKLKSYVMNKPIKTLVITVKRE